MINLFVKDYMTLQYTQGHGELSRTIKRERGIVLLLTLLVLTLLLIIIAQMTTTSSQNTIIAENSIQDIQNSYGIKSAFNHGMLFIIHDTETQSEVDSLHERWAQEIKVDLEGVNVTAKIIDESSKINLSALIKQDGKVNTRLKDILVRLVKNLGYEEAIAYRIIDYIDPDTEGQYETGVKDSNLHNIEELLSIPEVSPEIAYGTEQEGVKKKGLIEFLTVWPKEKALDDFKVNINTASIEVIMSLSDLVTQQIAENIALERSRIADNQPKHFTKIDDVQNFFKSQGYSDEVFNAIKDMIKVKTNIFSIEAKSSVGRLEKTWIHMVTRDPQAKTARLTSSYRINRHLALKPATNK